MSSSALTGSEFRFDKRRVDATVTLSSGQSTRGHFFTAGNNTKHQGPERVGDLLNAEPGFFPFEMHEGARPATVLYNRAHVVLVGLHENARNARPGL